MALTYKTDVITLNAANTDFTILTASASSTLVKNISWIHDDHNTNIILSITKSGGSKISIGEYAATANTSTKIWTDVLPLGANDVLHLQSDHISGTDLGYCVISYVEDTANVAGQSIGVHTDVSISGITDGQVLEWNNSTTQFEPATVSGGAADTDGLTEGSTNLYFTDARVAANSAVTANTAKAGITTQQASDITSNNAKVGITTAQANEITANTAKVGITTQQASDITANNAKTGITSGQASAITANTAKVSYTDAAVDARITAARTPYAFDEFVTDRNITMGSDVSQSTNLICDVLGDALAAKNNANAKKLLGWHTGSGTVVLQGFIDVNNSLSATAGQALWLGASGSISTSAPTTSNEYARVIGHYIGQGQGGEVMVYFNPSPDWIQID